MRKYLLLAPMLLACCMIAALTACGDDEDKGFSLDVSAASIPAGGGSLMVKVYSPQEIKVMSTAAWLGVRKGDYNASLKATPVYISAAANNTLVLREATVQVTCGNEERTLYVKQKPKETPGGDDQPLKPDTITTDSAGVRPYIHIF